MNAGAPPPSEPVLTVTGEKVALGPWHRGALPLIWRWENDAPLAALTGDPTMALPLEAFEAEYERFAREEHRDSVRFLIYERATLAPIGGCGLGRISHLHRTAELGIWIGDPTKRGQGYGTEATRLLLDYAFTALGLHNVMLRVFAYNERAIRAYLRAGFKEIGRRRGAHRQRGEPFDEVLMDCIAPEFTGGFLRDVMP